MRVFIIVIVLILSLQSWTKADDISEFQIEGISIGDSLLDHFTKEKIDNNKPIYYNDNEFSTFELLPFNSSKDYDGIQVIYRTNDKTYKIYSITGAVTCKNSFKDCDKAWEKILPDLTSMFKNETNIIDNGEYSHPGDKTGNSRQYQIIFEFETGDRVALEMTNWSKEMGYIDSLKINIDTKEFVKWLNTKAYK